MPGGNGTGPNGMGPMTGRGLGYCSGAATYGIGRRFGCGMGRGSGRGMGRGFRNQPPFRAGNWSLEANAFTPEQELGTLRQQAEAMQRSLEQINQRINELQQQNGSQT